MRTTTGSDGGRPMVAARGGVVTSGHYLATEAGMQMFRLGGNAVDAAAATAFVLALVQPHQNGVGGEVPILHYNAKERRVWAVSGHGVAPREATLERFRGMDLRIVPGDGFLPAVVPPAVGTWIRMLERFGTKRLTTVIEPALELAVDGFPMYDALRRSIEGVAERFRTEWPGSAALYLRSGAVPDVLELVRNPDWARTFFSLAEAERRYHSRAKGLKAAYDEFYRGSVTRAIVAFARSTPVRDASGEEHTALLDERDFAELEIRFEEPVRATYRGVEVCKCGPWTQGPVLLQALTLLEQFDLRAMGHNSARYIHTVVECMKLAFADREVHYGDPLFVDVPLETLLSREYAVERARLVDPQKASPELRPGLIPGLTGFGAADVTDVDRALAGTTAGAGPDQGDTTKLEVIDAKGNMVSATPSGGWLQSSPVIPGLGFPLGTRGQMFSLEPSHPNRLEPGKRPRSSLTPSLALRDGKPYLSFGSPGGDQQDQWALQFFLNVVEFGMSLQDAVEAPTFWTQHFPSSFYPRRAEPGSLYVEGRIPESVTQELERLGHRVTRTAAFAGGNTLAASIHEPSGLRCAAASPRLDPAYAAGW